MKRTPIVWIVAVLIFAARPAYAWDDFGHRLVARIAWEQMTPQARARAIQIMQGAAPDTRLLQGFGTGTLSPQRQIDLFVSGATWPDDIRPPNPRAGKYHVRDRHFTDIFWEQRWDFGPVRPSSLPESGDLLKDVAQLQQDLTGMDREKAAVALAWLQHLVGDIHQPLHASGRVTPLDSDGDEGGNGFKLERLSNGDRRSLHSFWDGIVTRNVRRQQGESDQAFLTRAAQEIAQRHPRTEFGAEIDQRDFRQWAEASVRIAQRTVYRPPLVRNQAAPTAYQRAAFRAAEPRIALAGYRLAELLNQALR
jgi:hypothetical protein